MNIAGELGDVVGVQVIAQRGAVEVDLGNVDVLFHGVGRVAWCGERCQGLGFSFSFSPIPPLPLPLPSKWYIFIVVGIKKSVDNSPKLLIYKGKACG